MTDPTTPVPPTSIDELLRHHEWLRRLAGRLIADPAAADDAVQQTWLAALRNRPRSGAPVKGWLATVLRNTLRQRHRESTRRDTRERAVAVTERDTDTTETVERFELQRRLVEEVAALDEPYRTTVLLRFFEDRTPTEIATRQDVPVKTIESRLYRAQRKLRERMDARHAGDREAWCAPLAPWALGASGGGGAAATSASLAAIQGTTVTMNIAKLAAAAVLALLTVGTWTAFGPGDDEPARDPGAGDRSVAAASESEGPAAGAEREAAAAPTPASESEAPPAQGEPTPRVGATKELVIRVDDDFGAPAPRVRVALVQVGVVVAQGETNDHGEVSFEPIGGALDCAVTGGAVWPSVHRVDGSGGRQLVQLPTGAPLGGVVRVDGRPPLEPVRVIFDVHAQSVTELALPPEVWKALGQPGLGPGALTVDTDADGRFRFVGLPAGVRGRLRVFTEGLMKEAGGPPLFDVVAMRADLELRLTRLPRLGGRLLDPTGAPMPKGFLSFRTQHGSRMRFTDAEGRFEHQLTDAGVTEIEILARATRGESRTTFSFSGPFAPIHDLGDLRLDESRSITMRVVGHEGRPVVGAYAYVDGGWDSSSAPSDAGGLLTMRIAPSIEHLIVAAEGYELRRVPVAAVASPGSVVRLTKATSLVVHLVGPDPLPHRTVHVRVRSAGMIFSEAEFQLVERQGEWATPRGMHHDADGSGAAFPFRADGRCLIRRLVPGVPFELTVKTGLGTVLADHRLVLSPGEERVIDVETATIRSVEGLVRGPDDRPVGRARVGIAHLEAQSTRVWTKSDGRFVFEDVMAPTVTVLVERPGFAPYRLEDVVVPADGLKLDIRLEPARVVDVIIFDTAGAPVDDIEVRAEAPTTRDVLVPFNDSEPTRDGKTTLFDLPTGPVTIAFEYAGGAFERTLAIGVSEAHFIVPATGRVTARWNIPTDEVRFGRLRLESVDGANATIFGNDDVLSGEGGTTIESAVPGTYAVTLEKWHDDWEGSDVVMRGTVVVLAGTAAEVVWE